MNIAALTNEMERLIDQERFSGVISIRRRGAVLYERAAGFADRSHQIENTLATRFGTASGTKFFTALAIGQLIEAGALSFATRLADFADLPIPSYSPEITVRHLLTHTSGIPDYFDEEAVDDVEAFWVGKPWYELRRIADYLALLPDEAPKFAPGARFAYSNSGYILLGAIIEAVTGASYQTYVEEKLFNPIGMSRSGFFALNRLPAATARGYLEDEHGWRTNVYNLPIVGAADGGAYTTVRDLARLWEAFWSGRIVSREMVDLYVRPHVPAGSQKHFGHGIWIFDAGSPRREEYIEGYDAGVSFYSSTRRAAQLQVTVISNTTAGAWPMVNAIDAWWSAHSGADSP